ncbi:hypothetical protein [Parapedobacter tibetensis]|uniref:hypothetical protein n=1 Tax=Parapedobacter tibetensis TaxID=2972951 RepID=UPI00214D20D4|nr:hypothetical protein [Parapedobacter tibetensis]
MLVALLAVGLQHVVDPTIILSPHFWLLFTVVFILTLVAYVLSDLGIRKGEELSVYGPIAGLFVKLLACLAVVAILIIKFPENKVLTALNFFSLYFLFTVFEVICLLRNLRDQKKS